MLRYDLDRLGWHDFEAAIEVLLKAKLGLGIESWGGTHGDWGRDAYFKGTLFYPTNQPSTGEFVFQCKFVQGANAAGARPQSALVNAVNSECRRLKKRGTQPLHYALITNSPLSPKLHTSLAHSLTNAMPDTAIHLHGASDICDWFDLTPHVARAFPQVFGLRRIHDLLRSWSRPDLIKRSRLLINHAAEEATTFVPTQAFRKAFDIVRTRNLVMLEGPPEMGKTTIGRMLALAAVASDKMEALECPRPRDLFDAHDDERAQVFVIDDCFGRSSYDPTLGTEWERELGSVLRLLDSKHWLVLTSRAHLLNFAVSALDFDRRAAERLSRCRVIVDADSLSEVEKAQIIYRHGKHSSLSHARTSELRSMAPRIINDDKFTPERIRVLVERASSERGSVNELMQECLETPTNSMRKSFRALPEQHKWLLYAFLEQSNWVLISSLEKSYNNLCPDAVRRPLNEVVRQLDNAFVRASKHGSSIDVVHPTVLDLVVEELALDVCARQRYLSRCKGDGLTIALMLRGGGRGTTIAPLLGGESEWTLVEARGIEELRRGRAHVLELLRLICRHNRDTPLSARAEQVLTRIAKATVVELNEADLWTTDSVLIYSRAMRGTYIPLIDGVWERQVIAIKEEFDKPGSSERQHLRLKELSELAELIVHSHWAVISDKTLLWKGICNALQWTYDTETWSDDLDDWGWDDDDELDDAEAFIEQIEESIETLRGCLPEPGIASQELAERINHANALAQEMESCCGSLRDAIESRREDVETKAQETNEQTSTQRVVDIGSIFEDF